MYDDQYFDQIHGRLKDIVNSLYNLGKPLSETRVIKKILRSLPDKFISKVTSIEKFKDLNTLFENELIGSLKTYESDVLNRFSSKGLVNKRIRPNSFVNTSGETRSCVGKQMCFLTKMLNHVFERSWLSVPLNKHEENCNENLLRDTYITSFRNLESSKGHHLALAVNLDPNDPLSNKAESKELKVSRQLRALTNTFKS